MKYYTWILWHGRALHRSLCLDLYKCDSWTVALALWEQAVSLPKLPISSRGTVFPFRFVLLFSLLSLLFSVLQLFLRFDRRLLLNTTITVLKTRCPAVVSRTDELWRSQLYLEDGKSASLKEGGRHFRRNRVCFILKYWCCQYRESDEAAILLSAGVGGAGVSAHPLPFPSLAPRGDWQDLSVQEPQLQITLLKN